MTTPTRRQTATPVVPPAAAIPASMVGAELSAGARYLILATAFLGWMFAGSIMSIGRLAGRPAIISFLGEKASQGEVGKWLAWYTVAFLLGAAAGGLLFGWLGDRIGRSKAMGWSILCYSLLTGAGYFSHTLPEFLVLRFLACLGVGGIWPNGNALASEAWSNVSRPTLAGLIGAAANVGFVLLAAISYVGIPITPGSWRWVMELGTLPVLLGIFVLLAVPESRRWLASRTLQSSGKQASPVVELFRPPLLRLTIIGIVLGTLPVLGGWGSSHWLVPWADKASGGDDSLKSLVQMLNSGGAILGSLLGGWLAALLGRRITYFLISLGSLAVSQYIFRNLTPLDPQFLTWVTILGFVGTIYFGWMPLFLPELFPTRVRSTGSGIAFNFGRIGAAIGVLGAGSLMVYYHENYPQVSSIMSLVYALGMVTIWFAPDTSHKSLDD